MRVHQGQLSGTERAHDPARFPLFLLNERLPRVVFLQERPRAQWTSRNHSYGCKQQEVYSDTQVPGATKSLERLAHARLGRGVFIGEQKCAYRSEMRGYGDSSHWSIQIRLRARAEWQILDLSPKYQGGGCLGAFCFSYLFLLP